MKKMILMCAAMLLLAASTATADSLPLIFHYPSSAVDPQHSYTAVAQVQLSWNGIWNGGPFQVSLATPSQLLDTQYGLGQGSLTGVQVPFPTFCVENNVYFYPNTTYFASIDDIAAQGGNSTNPLAQNTLTPGAAWIYYQYRQGNLSAFQDWQISEAIWYEMGLTTSNGEYFNGHPDWGVANGITTLVDAAHPVDIGGVRVLNLWTLTKSGNNWIATDVQSQLILENASLPPNLVPAPAAIVLGLIGLSALGLYMRRYA